MEDPNKSLREAVVAMAQSKPRRRSNRNPLYKKPNPAFREWAAIVGYCDGILALDFDLARNGPVDEAQRARDMVSIHAAIRKLGGVA